MSIVSEEWRKIPSMPGYEVSSEGRVRSVDRSVVDINGTTRNYRGQVLSTANRLDGYKSISFSGRPPHLVHRLVASAFHGPAEPGMDVNHIDGDKSNNSAVNLEYVDHRGNMKHARETGLWNNRGVGNGQARTTEEQIRVAHALVVGGMSRKAAAQRVGASIIAIGKALRGEKWKHLNLRTVKAEV